MGIFVLTGNVCRLIVTVLTVTFMRTTGGIENYYRFMG